MKFMKFFISIVCALSCQIAASADLYKYDKSLHREYKTQEEKENLFKALGVTYINETVYSQTWLAQDARETRAYKDLDPEDCTDFSVCYETTSNLYSDDIAQGTLAPMSIRWINKSIGYGVFAEDKILQKSFIGVYAGNILDAEGLDETCSGLYAWGPFPIDNKNPEQGMCDNFLPIIDAAVMGNELRFINDGGVSDINCWPLDVIGKDNLWHRCYIATRDIKKGEQLLTHYGEGYWKQDGLKFQRLSSSRFSGQFISSCTLS